MLVWFAVQTLPIPDPTSLLDYGPLGVLVIFALLGTAVLWKLGPAALKAWTEMNICAAKQSAVLERTTAAVEEHRTQSAFEHQVQMEAFGTTTSVLENLDRSTQQLSDEIKRRNGH